MCFPGFLEMGPAPGTPATGKSHKNCKEKYTLDGLYRLLHCYILFFPKRHGALVRHPLGIDSALGVSLAVFVALPGKARSR